MAMTTIGKLEWMPTMSTARTQPEKTPTKAQPGTKHESADSHGGKQAAGAANVLMRLADLRSSVAIASAQDEVTASSAVQSSAVHSSANPSPSDSSDQPSSESSESSDQGQAPRRADRPAPVASNTRRQRRERQSPSTAAGWIRPVWQVAAGCGLVLMFFAAYLVLVNKPTSSDSSKASTAAKEPADSLVSIELPPEYTATLKQPTMDVNETKAKTAEHKVRLQAPQWSSQPLQSESDKATVQPLDSAPIAQQPPAKPERSIQPQPQPGSSNNDREPLDRGGSYYDGSKLAKEPAATPRYTYPVTDPSTYLYPAGSGMATLRGTIEQPPTRSR
jgi:hypothetical protein